MCQMLLLFYAKTAKANPLLIYGEDRLSVSCSLTSHISYWLR
jgi:hypothetical protein